MAARQRTRGVAPRQWAPEARDLYERGTPMADLCARFDVSESTLCLLAKLEGWDKSARRVALGIGAPPPESGQRVCRVCREPKPDAAFRPVGAGKAPRATCRRCERDAVVAQKQRARVRDAEREGREYLSRAEFDARQRAESERREAECRDEMRRRSLLRDFRRLLGALHRVRYVEAHGITPDGMEYRERWRRDATFRQKERERQQRYKHANPEAAARYGDTRKQRAAATADGTLTRRVVRALFRTADLCPYCAVEMGPRDRVLDHKEPLARGGAHSLGNVLVCCRRCNREKRDRPWAEWCAIVAERAGVREEPRSVPAMPRVPRRHEKKHAGAAGPGCSRVSQ